jgi:hypothetical protein
MAKCGGFLGLAVSVLVLALAGCNKKVPECNSMVEVINPAVETIGKASGAKSEKGTEQAKAIQDMAAILQKTAGTLAKLELTTPELKKFSSEYQAMCNGAAANANKLAELVLSMEPKAKEAEAIQKSLSSTVERFNTQCGAPKAPQECENVGKKLQGAPSDLEKTAEIEKFVAELSQLKVADAGLKATVEATIKGYRDGSKLMTSIKTIEKQSEAASAAMDQALNKESPLVDGLNAFCKG